jgi:two-component system chemotaxis response regulator CheY
MEFLSVLRSEEEGKRPVVVFCTTENDMAHIRAAIDAGADEYIMKPFDRDVIEAKLIQVGAL